MGILDKITGWARDVHETQAAEQENMKYKTDEQLKKIIAEGGTSGWAIGRARAARDELRRRGYNV